MDVETSYSDFINCDRTGRRNAVPDIAGEGTAGASTSELTKDLAEMDLKAAGQYTHIFELLSKNRMKAEERCRPAVFTILYTTHLSVQKVKIQTGGFALLKI